MSSHNAAGNAIFQFTPKSVGKWMFLIALLLFILNIVALVLSGVLGRDDFATNALMRYFDASQEGNIPTLYSTLVLFSAALLLFIIYLSPFITRFRYHWLALGLIFIFLMIDEATGIHEQFNKYTPVKDVKQGYLYYGWIVPYAALALVAGLAFLRFITSLPSKPGKLFFVSGFMYVAAALCFELLEGRVTYLYGSDHLYDKLLCAIEEFLEMSSIVLFNYALLDFFAMAHSKMEVRLVK